MGRRLAYDPAAGRLWVVCRQCERWNLSPLETRWEAIEEAERAFRDTPLRVSTDNIGLARLREGLELVRVGKPPERELLAWRYGDQFGKRRRKFLTYAAVGGVAGAVAVGATFANMFGVTIAGLGALGSIASASLNLANLRNLRATQKELGAIIDGPDGAPIALTKSYVRCAALVPVHEGWELKLPYHPKRTAEMEAAGTLRNAAPPIVLHGEAAQRALSAMLPELNRYGGGTRQVNAAFDVLHEMPTIDALLREGAVNTEAVKTQMKLKTGESNVGVLPARLRLAMEMVLHTDQERRAMEGELALLETQWREADEIAKIADALLLPEQVEARLTALRNTSKPDAD